MKNKKSKIIINLIMIENGKYTWSLIQKGKFFFNEQELILFFDEIKNYFIRMKETEKMIEEDKRDKEENPEKYIDISFYEEIKNSDLIDRTEFKCKQCSGFLYSTKVNNNYYYCPNCKLQNHKDYL